MTATECPTPGKTAFTSEHAAKRALRSIRHPHGQMRPYRCGSHWHLGHGTKTWTEPKKTSRRASR